MALGPVACSQPKGDSPPPAKAPPAATSGYSVQPASADLSGLIVSIQATEPPTVDEDSTPAQGEPESDESSQVTGGAQAHKVAPAPDERWLDVKSVARNSTDATMTDLYKWNPYHGNSFGPTITDAAGGSVPIIGQSVRIKGGTEALPGATSGLRPGGTVSVRQTRLVKRGHTLFVRWGFDESRVATFTIR
jgi:hypothetical protein